MSTEMESDGYADGSMSDTLTKDSDDSLMKPPLIDMQEVNGGMSKPQAVVDR